MLRISTVLALAAAAIVSHPRQAVALPITAGESLTFDFDGLPFVAPEVAQPQGGAFPFLAEDTLDAGELVLMEMFEDHTSTTPFFAHVFDTPTDQFGASVNNTLVDDSHPWQDLEGLVKITMLQGSVDVDFVRVRVFRPEGLYEQDLAAVPTSIPEPSTLLLLGSGVTAAQRFRRVATNTFRARNAVETK